MTNDRSDLMSHLAEEIYNGRMTVEEANKLIGIRPVDSLVEMSEDDVNSYYMEYINA
jgi:hypothetical protein